MEDNIELGILVDRSLQYYDNKINKYKKYSLTDKIAVDRDKNTIQFPDINTKIFNYEVLGVFDNTTSIWLWAWMVPEFIASETNIVKKLLNYGLKINPTITDKIPDDKLYLKTQLVNSRFLLQDEFQLDIHLAISCYLAKDNFKFIYAKKKYLSFDKSRYLTVYYLII